MEVDIPNALFIIIEMSNWLDEFSGVVSVVIGGIAFNIFIGYLLNLGE